MAKSDKPVREVVKITASGSRTAAERAAKATNTASEGVGTPLNTSKGTKALGSVHKLGTVFGKKPAKPAKATKTVIPPVEPPVAPQAAPQDTKVKPVEIKAKPAPAPTEAQQPT